MILTLAQIADILNAAAPNVTATTVNGSGETVTTTVLVAEDLSNISQLGEMWDSNTDMGDNFNSYYQKISDKVGKTVFAGLYEGDSDEINLYKDSMEAGSILEMVHFRDGEYVDNTSWDIMLSGSETAAPTFDEMFGYHPVDAEAEYFNGLQTLASEVYTVTYLQWKSACVSASAMTQFMNAIAKRWQNKLNRDIKKLKKMLVATFIIEKCRHDYNGVVNLLARYKTLFPTATVTADTAMYDADFLRFYKSETEIIRGNLRGETGLYNTGAFVQATPASRQRALMYEPLETRAETYLLANTIHPEFYTKGNYQKISYWQGIGDGMDDSTKMRISAKTPKRLDSYVQDGVCGVVFDEYAIMQYGEYQRTVAQNNAFSEWTNYQHKYDVQNFVSLNENGVVFVISDYEFDAATSTAAAEPSDWDTKIAAGIYTKSTTGEYTAVLTNADWVSGTQYFTKIA